MRTINETFTEEEYKNLLTLKNGATWHDFILSILDKKERDKDEPV